MTWIMVQFLRLAAGACENQARQLLDGGVSYVSAKHKWDAYFDHYEANQALLRAANRYEGSL